MITVIATNPDHRWHNTILRTTTTITIEQHLRVQVGVPTSATSSQSSYASMLRSVCVLCLCLVRASLSCQWCDVWCDVWCGARQAVAPETALIFHYTGDNGGLPSAQDVRTFWTGLQTKVEAMPFPNEGKTNSHASTPATCASTPRPPSWHRRWTPSPTRFAAPRRSRACRW